MKLRLTGLFLVLWIGVVSAQGNKGILQGEVRDAAGGEVPGANVAVKGPALPKGSGAATDESGKYRIGALPPGTYQVTFTHIGYRTAVKKNVRIQAGATRELDVVLQSQLIQLEQNVVSASRRQEKALEAPASVAVIEAGEIQDNPALTVSEHVRDLPAVDFAQTGLVQSSAVVRGFNNVFSGALLTLTDNRIAGVPSLRLNVYNFIPLTNDDIERIEVVLGPGSALYGPNSANGVMHLISRSPFNSAGTSATVGLGERSLRQVSLRHAGVLSPKLGYKISAQYYAGTDWKYYDPDESKPAQADAAKGYQVVVGGDTLYSRRDFDIERQSVEVRVDYRPKDDLSAIFSLGYNNGDHIEMTGLGAGQIVGWGMNFAQTRLRYRDWFAQVYHNWSSAGDTYLLNTGVNITDRSSLTVFQVQHMASLGARQRFTYGGDVLLTRPDTERSINGQNEGHDSIDEMGAYLQSETALSDKLDLVLALRYDDHSRLDEEEVSPRAGLVFKPREDQILRLTYNRAFSTPTALNLYLDLASKKDPYSLEESFGPFFALQGLEFEPIDLRVQGTYRKDFDEGFTFVYGDNGLPQFRSPFAPLAGAPTDQYIDMNDPMFTNVMWGVGRSAVITQFEQKLAPLVGQETAGALAAALGIVPARLGGLGNVMRTLNLEKVKAEDPSPFDLAVSVTDVPRSRATITQTYELGYKGVVGGKLVVAADVYRTRTEDFGGPLRVETPNVFLDPDSLVAALGPAITQALADNDPQAQALAALDDPAMGGNGNGVVVDELVAMFANGAARIPFGTVSPQEAYDPIGVLMTYRNFNEDVVVNGLDLSLGYYPNNTWSFTGSYSFVDDNFFENLGGVGDIALNSPKHKFKLGATYKVPDVNLKLGGRLRYNGSFPMQSGVFEGEVDSYTVLDLNLVYKLPLQPDLKLRVDAGNILNNEHREFVGAPEVGRLVFAQLGVGF